MDGEVAHHEPTEGGCSGTHLTVAAQQPVFLILPRLHQDAGQAIGIDTLITIGDQK